MSPQNFKIAHKFQAFYVISSPKILKLLLNLNFFLVMSPYTSMSGSAPAYIFTHDTISASLYCICTGLGKDPISFKKKRKKKISPYFVIENM
jgi:hypothetical protein